ncbi:MAG: Rpn family recombination-promoting nuclease/putative transposase [Planctomycetes bacterium]|nr:Rpn family recombination-promoting nuclease/putative transposase [Planctomycetota bacterium]
MAKFEEPPLHDFPDRAIRKLLENPQNLRDLLVAIVPDLAAHLDFEHLEPVDRSFLLEDWRGRESDLLFRIPYQTPEEAKPVVVCVLLEHQSAPDPRMPLRILVYAVLYWEREWKAWEDKHPPGEPLRLSPVLPVVFHTGPGPWKTNRELAELIAGPESLRALAPRWQPLFWDLAEQSPEALLNAAGEWLKALAVIRVEQEDSATFLPVLAEVLRRLEPLSGREKIRWHDLMWFILSWAFRRRPRQERDQLLATARASQMDLERQKEIQTMSQSIGMTWEQELLAEGKAEGKAQGLAEGALRTCKDNLKALLEARFGTLSETMVQRIEAATDLERLKAGIPQVLRMVAPEELQL